MPASTGDYADIRKQLADKQQEARNLTLEAGNTAASAQTFSDQVMTGVRAARAARGVDKLSEDMGTVAGQLVTENPAIRDRMSDVNPLAVDAATNARRGQLLSEMTTIGNVQTQREGTISEVIGANTNKILADAKMKEAKAAQAAAEADDLYKQYQMKLDEEKLQLEKDKAAKSSGLGSNVQALLAKFLTGSAAPDAGTGGTQTTTQPAGKTTTAPAQKKTQPEQKGFFDDIINPVKNYGKLLGEAGFQASRFLTDEAYRKAVLNQPLTPAEAKKLATTKPTAFLTEDQAGSPEKIAKFGSKATAGTAALALPAGESITAAALLGSLGGAANAYANDENIAGGAAGGAAGGVAMRGLLKLLGLGKNVVGTTGQKLRQSIVNPIVADNPFAAEEEKALQQTLADLGLKGSAAAQREQAPTVFRKINDQITERLASIKKMVSLTDAITSVNKNLDQNVNYDVTIPAYKKAYDKFINQFTALANKNAKNNALELTGKSLFEFKQNLGNQLSRAFSKIEAGQALTPQEEVGLSIWQSMDNMISGLDPELKKLTLAQSALYKASPGLRKSAAKAVTVPFTNVPIPGATRVVQGAGDLVGRAAEKIGNTPTSGNAANSMTKLAQMLGINLGEHVGTGGTPATQPQTDTSVTTDQTGSQLPRLTQDQFQQLAVADLAETGGKNLNELKILYDMMNNGGKMTEKQQAYKSASEGASYALSLLNSGKIATGIGQGVMGNIGEKAGFNSPQQQDYRSTIAGIRTLLKNALLGGNMSAPEIESLSPLIPEFDDAPSTAKQKLTTFIREAKRFSGAEISPADQVNSMFGK